jgi:hypothetical protein
MFCFAKYFAKDVFSEQITTKISHKLVEFLWGNGNKSIPQSVFNKQRTLAQYLSQFFTSFCENDNKVKFLLD